MYLFFVAVNYHPHSRSFHTGHSLQRHPSATMYPENPCPRYRLNFDGDDDTTSSSVSQDSVKGSSPPDIFDGYFLYKFLFTFDFRTPPSARSVRSTKNKVSRNLYKEEYSNGPAGDWSNTIRQHDFSDSDEDMIRRR